MPNATAWASAGGNRGNLECHRHFSNVDDTQLKYPKN